MRLCVSVVMAEKGETVFRYLNSWEIDVVVESRLVDLDWYSDTRFIDLYHNFQLLYNLPYATRKVDVSYLQVIDLCYVTSGVVVWPLALIFVVWPLPLSVKYIIYCHEISFCEKHLRNVDTLSVNKMLMYGPKAWRSKEILMWLPFLTLITFWGRNGNVRLGRCK